jgi:hypothetical protein
MLLTPLFLLILGLLNLLNLVLPTGTLPTQVASGFQSIIGAMYSVNSFFPIDTLIYLAGLALSLQAVILLWKLVVFIISYVRGN